MFCTLDEDLLEIRKALVTPRPLSGNNGGPDLRSLNRKLISGLGERLRNHMTNLQLFLDPELTFAVKANFRTSFCRTAVREGIVVSHFKQIIKIAENFCSDDTTDRTVPPLLLLLLSRTCLDLQASTLQNIMSSVDEQFFIGKVSHKMSIITSFGHLSNIITFLL